MIQNNTILNVVDNSGAKTVLCIKVGKGFNRRYAFPGDLIVVAIKTLRSKRRSTITITKGEVCKALVLRCKFSVLDRKSENFSFLENSVVLLSRQNKFIFTRVFGVVPYFIRYTRYMRIITMSSGLMK